jgi:tricorn protease
MFNEDSPAWHPGGDYLYFMANHEFQPQISQIEFDFATNRARGIFVMALRKDVKNPFPTGERRSDYQRRLRNC